MAPRSTPTILATSVRASSPLHFKRVRRHLHSLCELYHRTRVYLLRHSPTTASKGVRTTSMVSLYLRANGFHICGEPADPFHTSFQLLFGRNTRSLPPKFRKVRKPDAAAHLRPYAQQPRTFVREFMTGNNVHAHTHSQPAWLAGGTLPLFSLHPLSASRISRVLSPADGAL